MDPYYPASPNWFQRNWKWFVPSGCIGLIGGFIILAFALFFGITSSMRSSDVYQYSMQTAKKNKHVVELIGNNIEENGMLTGTIHTSGHSGNAEFDIPIKGSKGKGVIHVEAQKQNTIWNYTTLHFYPDGSFKTINLLEKNP